MSCWSGLYAGFFARAIGLQPENELTITGGVD
jgi:hypothetical protein